MTDTLRHRGPDGEGFYTDEDVALGVRRLGVIDLEGGAQPISNEAGTVWAVLNGEIYNFRELRRALEGRGHRFRTASDTEVIVHAWEDAGESFVRDLDGMFALALWDVTRRVLMLARDRLGEKPLYYSAGPEAFAFGSEIRALLQCPTVSRRLSLESLSRYLAFEGIPAPRSILESVAKVPPAHTVTIAPGRAPRLRPFWEHSFAPDESVTESQWTERLQDQLEVSARSRLVADVPIGLFLSGGIDSGAVGAFASRAVTSPLPSFTVGFREPTYDERASARRVAQWLGTTHQDVVFSAADALGLLDRVGELLDEPLVDASFLPKYALALAARRTVKVVLSGDGGDELFGGYPTFIAVQHLPWVSRLVPGPLQRGLSWVLDQIPPSPRYGSLELLLKQFLRALPHSPVVATQLLLGGLTVQEQAPLLSRGVRGALVDFDPHEELRRAIEANPSLDPIARAVSQHCTYYLAGQTLVAMDRAAMAAGLEVRAPFLDPALIELAARIPSRYKVRGATTKYVLKRALRRILPDDVIDRRKQGLGVPIAAWLRGPLRGPLAERLAPDRLAKRGLFEPTTVNRLIAEHVAGRRDHRKVLWALMMFDAWCDHYLPGERWT